MLITHDTRCALDTVVDLVNTAPDDDTTDALPDVDALEDFVRKHNISDIGVLSEIDLAAVRRIRGRFAGVFAAQEARTAASLINELVAAAGTTPRLTDHDGYDWHVHYFAPGASIADHLAADCGMALAFFVVMRRAGAAAALRGPGLPTRLRRRLPQSVSPLLRQPHLRKPASCGGLPGAPQGVGELTAGKPELDADAAPGGWRRGLACTAHSNSRSCNEAMSSRHPITARKIISGGWERAKRHPRGSSFGGTASLCVVSSISPR